MKFNGIGNIERVYVREEKSFLEPISNNPQSNHIATDQEMWDWIEGRKRKKIVRESDISEEEFFRQRKQNFRENLRKQGLLR